MRSRHRLGEGAGGVFCGGGGVNLADDLGAKNIYYC